MSTTHFRYVIIGGGVGAGYAARTFVAEDEEVGSQLCILSADDALPYERPALSKQFLAGEESLDDILINSADFYSEHDIDIRLETVVDAIDFDQREVHIGADRIGFDNLLIATGATPKRLPLPGFDLAGVHTLRQVDDARAILRETADVERAVVLGGSFIGMEVAATLQDRGVATSMVFPEGRVWEAFFTPAMSDFFERYYRERGVEIFSRVKPKELLGSDGHVEHVVLETGRALPAELVVAGVGVAPNVDLARETPLHLDDGIVVNRFLETNVRGVFAAGDVARFRDPRTDELRRIEHWDNAKTQAQHAARGMLGMRREYRHVPYFFSDVFDLSYEFWGDTSHAATTVRRGSFDDAAFSTWWLDDDNRLVAAFVMSRPDEERELAPAWIRDGVELDPDVLRRAEALQGAAAEPQI